MKQTGWRLGGLAAGAFLYAFAAPAFAQDAATGTGPAKPGAAKPATTSSDRAAAVKTVDTWESADQGQPETVEDSFFRLARDFLSNYDNGFRRLGSVPIWPRGEMKFGGFRIFPFLREAVEWEDNYYLQPATGPSEHDHGRQPQWTHVNEVGVIADTTLAGGRLNIGVGADSVWNVRYGDAPPDTWDFQGNLTARYTWPTGVWLEGGMTYDRRHDPADLPNLSNDYGRSDRSAFLNLGFDRDIFFGSKLKYEVGIESSNYQAQDAAYSDMNRTENTLHVRVSYPFLRDTTRIFVLGRYRLDNRNSDAINDGKTFGLNVGLEGAIPLREGSYRSIRGEISVGFTDSLYDNDVYTRGSDRNVADDNRASTNLDVQAALQYVMSPRSTADLRYVHGTQFSFYGNYEVVDRIDLSFSHNFSRRLTGRISTYYEHTNPSGRSAPQTIPPNDYSNNAPNTSLEGLGVGIRYAFNEWMDIDLSADVENRNDHTSGSYKNYRGVLGVTFFLNALTPKPRTAITP